MKIQYILCLLGIIFSGVSYSQTYTVDDCVQRGGQRLDCRQPEIYFSGTFHWSPNFPSKNRYATGQEACEAQKSSFDNIPGAIWQRVKFVPWQEANPDDRGVGVCWHTYIWTHTNEEITADYSQAIENEACLPLADAVLDVPGKWWAHLCGYKLNYHLVLLSDSPPPSACAGNPVELSAGKKYQSETDHWPQEIGGISFERFYSNADPSKVFWKHTFNRDLVVIDPLASVSIRQKSSSFNLPSDACLYGWNNIRSAISDAWAMGSIAEYSNGSCHIKRNGVIVKSLPIVPPNYISLGTIQLRRPNGSTIEFQYNGNSGFASLAGDYGTLQHIATGIVKWRYQSNTGDIEDYSSTGKLLSITSPNTRKQTLTYDSNSGLLSQVQDATDRKLTFTYANNLLNSITTDDNKTTSYTYNALGLITDVKRPDNTHRLYHYEDSRFPTYLTGITDERGARYATWTYDTKGRAISSEHVGGAEKALLAFNADGSTTVTNALNKQTVYRFDDIAGARRVTSVEGQPTANCAGANQSYTYTPEGWVASKTDWNGNKTTYTYNTKGQEISRTEAFGSAVAKTIVTEWHATLNLKTKVTEPDRETTYSYNATGLLLNQNTRSLP